MCAICLESFVDGDELRTLNCGHCFHRGCVDIWLLGTLSEESLVTSICPTCRRDLSSSSSTVLVNISDTFAPLHDMWYAYGAAKGMLQHLLTKKSNDNNNIIVIHILADIYSNYVHIYTLEWLVMTMLQQEEHLLRNTIYATSSRTTSHYDMHTSR